MKIYYLEDSNSVCGNAVKAISAIIAAVGCLLVFNQAALLFSNGFNGKDFLVFIAEIIAFGFTSYTSWRVGEKLSLENESLVEWRKYLKENGIRCMGEVVRQVTHIGLGSSSVNEYHTFVVSYFSQYYKGKKEFETARIPFEPDPSKKYICIVYEAPKEAMDMEEPGDITSHYFSANPFKPICSACIKERKLLYGAAFADGFKETEAE